MQPRDAREVLPREGGAADAQAGVRRAGVVDRHLPLGMLGIDAQAHGDLPAARVGRGHTPPLRQLRKGVQRDVVEPRVEQLGHLALGESRGEGVPLAPELPAQERLVHAAGAGALSVKVREGHRHRKGLQGQQQVRAGGLRDLAQDGRVAAQGLHIHHEGGRLGQSVHNHAPSIQMRTNAPSASEKRRHDRRSRASCPSSRASRVPPAAM